MQFKVPQDVQREDRIVGPLTLKQLIICGIGGVIAYAIYVSIGRSYHAISALLPAIPVILVTLAFAFIRPLDLSFTRWLLCWIEFAMIPRQRMWIQSAGEVHIPQIAPAKQTKVEKKAEAKAESILDKHRKLEELTKILDSQKNMSSNTDY